MDKCFINLSLSMKNMKCHSCRKKAVIHLPNSEICLCEHHFIRYFERKVRKTIRINKMIGKKEKIGIAVSGGKDSLSLLYILDKIFKPTRVKLVALSVDEGIEGYRDSHFTHVKKLCKKFKIPLKVYSFKKEYGKTLDEIEKKDKETIPCTYCGVLRRKLLNDKAHELGLDKLATAHTLDDEAQAILMNQFRKNVRASVMMGPITGVEDDPKFVRRIKPFYFLTEKETMSFAFLNNLLYETNGCPNAHRGFRKAVQKMINDFESKYPGSKYNIVASFLASLNGIKKSFTKSGIKYCKKCDSPTANETCQACVLLEKIR